MRKYKADLTDEIEPQVNELLARAEKGLQMFAKKESMLRTRVSHSIIPCPPFISLYYTKLETQQTKPNPRSTVNTAGMNKLEARRIQMLVRQREQLEQEMAALQAQVDALVYIPSIYLYMFWLIIATRNWQA